MFKAFSLVILSAVLLILAFPPFGFWPLAWISLVPLLISLDGLSRGRAFLCAWICGVFFYAGTLNWLINMAWSAGISPVLSCLAFISLSLYLACFFGLFGWGYSYFRDGSLRRRLFFSPALWVVLEFIRGHFLSGFGWLKLGTSQSFCLPVIQIAEVTGVYGISFLIVMVGVWLKECWSGRRDMKRLRSSGLTVAVIMTAVTIFGLLRLNVWRAPKLPVLTVAMVQPNIQQQQKWRPENWPVILEELLHMTREAATQEPDLIVWPETSFPGFLEQEPEAYARVKDLVRQLKVPLLFGAITKRNGRYHNSAILLSAAGAELAVYHKRHLVPFGEFLPLRNVLPFLGSLVPIADFSPGKETTLFALDAPTGNPFSVVICFEDTIARVVRPFVRVGAALLINITNDAWFMDSAEPYLHQQAAVFRSIENRRSLIRVANTGISGIIDPDGRVGKVLRNANAKSTFVSGVLNVSAVWYSGRTFYTRYGDVFALFCLFGLVLGFIASKKSS